MNPSTILNLLLVILELVAVAFLLAMAFSLLTAPFHILRKMDRQIQLLEQIRAGIGHPSAGPSMPTNRPDSI